MNCYSRKNAAAVIFIFNFILLTLVFDYSYSFGGGREFYSPEERALIYEKSGGEFKFDENFSDSYCAPRAELDENEELSFDLLNFTSPADCCAVIKLSDMDAGIAAISKDNKIILKNMKKTISAGKPVDYIIEIGSRQKKYITGTVVPVRKQYSAELYFDFKNYPELKRTDEIYAAGDMNGWDQKSLKLAVNKKKQTNDTADAAQIYSAAIPNIKKGEYKYKFIIGGEWKFDKANPDKLADEYGSFNSILKVGPPVLTPELVPGKISCQSGMIKFTVNYAGRSKNPILRCFYDGILIKDEFIKYIPGAGQFKVECPVDSYLLDGLKTHILKYYSYAYDQNSGLSELSDEYSFCNGLSASNRAGFRNSIIYFAMTDRFKNGNYYNDNPVSEKELDSRCNYYGGDFAGLASTAASNYFNYLNVNMLWISPVTAGPDRAFSDSLPPHRKFSGYHGYWPEKLDRIEPRFGSLNELQNLISGLRSQKNIEVLIDIALRHVTVTSDVYKKNKELFLNLYLPDGSKNIRKFDEFPESTWFDEFLPAFDFDKTAAIELMSGQAAEIIKMTGVKGMRLDAVKHIPHKFWNVFLNGRDKFFTVGETIDTREKIASYIAPGMITAQFDFPLYFAIVDTFAKCTMDFSVFEQELKKSEKIFWANHKLTSNLLGNHDFPRFMAYADGYYNGKNDPGDKELGFTAPPCVKNYKSYKKLRMAFAFLMSINGVPLIYYGDEYGETGAADPDNRRPMRFNGELDFLEKENLEIVRFLTGIRKKHPALFEGTRITLLCGKNDYVFAKCHFNETIIAAFNRNENPEILKFQLPDFIIANTLTGRNAVVYDMKTGEKFEADSYGKIAVPMYGYGFRYLKVLNY